ncbi:hypothetical protein MKQ70_28830 [Chitinophaga sedimenti]|uniref:hypothetical protein n=1 Tax=Chitinophaga sedimenti TaxID=2033606 RepID=UPI0020044D1B|nr:hypothetical protein [Chitinophaga sedimenti]MCK7558775.1 hypothetical protein [Chitinophaga sedimenti]
MHFHTLSPDRTDPFCQHFGECGGCKWQMLPYSMQLDYKHQQVVDHLTRIGKIALPDIMPILGGQETRYYRNKLEFTFSNKAYLTQKEMDAAGDGEIPRRNAVGFHIPKLFDKVLDIQECHLMAEPTNLIKNTIRDYAEANNLEFFDIRQQTGWLRNLVLRICTTGEVMANLVIHHEDKEAREALLDHILKTVPGITSLLYTINPKKNDSIFDRSRRYTTAKVM